MRLSHNLSEDSRPPEAGRTPSARHVLRALLRRATKIPALCDPFLEGLWLTIIGLVPLFFLPVCLRAFYLPKAVLLQALALLLVSAAIGAWLLEPHRSRTQWLRSLFPTSLHRAVLAFALVAIIATALSLTPWRSLTGSLDRNQGLVTTLSWVAVFFVISTRLHTGAQVKRLVVVVLVSSGLVSLIGVIEHYVPPFSSFFLRTAYTPRVASTTGNALSLSAYLGMAIPLTIATGMVVRARRTRMTRPRAVIMGLALLLTVQLWCLVLSIYSFVLLLYLLPAALFLALLALLGLRRRTLTIGTLALLAGVVLAGSAIVLPEWHNAVKGTAPYEPGTRLEQGTYERLHGTLYGRARYWVYALRVLPEAISSPQPGDRVPALRPFIGYGRETYVITTQKHYPPEYRSASTSGASFRDRPHNHFIYLAATTGLLGLGTFLIMMGAFIVLLKRLLRDAGVMSPSGLFALAAGCGIAGFLAHGIFNPIALSETTLLWTYLALVPAFLDRHENEQQSSPDQIQQSSDTARDNTRGRIAIVCALLIAALVAGVLPAARSIMAQRALSQAAVMSGTGNPRAVFVYSRATELKPRESVYWGALGGYAHSIALAADGDVKTDPLRLSLTAFEQAREHNHLLAFWHHQLGDALLYAATTTDLATVQDALRSYEQALELSPRNAVLANRAAVAHMVEADLSAASYALDKAAEYDPMWSRTDHLRIALMALEGDGHAAAGALTEAIRVSPAEMLTFSRVSASKLRTYGLYDDVAKVLQPALEGMPRDFAVLSAQAIVSALNDEEAQPSVLFSEAAREAMSEDEIDALESTVRYLSGFIPALRTVPGTGAV